MEDRRAEEKPHHQTAERHFERFGQGDVVGAPGKQDVQTAGEGARVEVHKLRLLQFCDALQVQRVPKATADRAGQHHGQPAERAEVQGQGEGHLQTGHEAQTDRRRGRGPGEGHREGELQAEPLAVQGREAAEGDQARETSAFRRTKRAPGGGDRGDPGQTQSGDEADRKRTTAGSPTRDHDKVPRPRQEPGG